MTNVGSSSSENYYREQLKSTEAQREESDRARSRASAQSESDSEQKLQDIQSNYESDLNETVERMRKHYNQQLETSHDENVNDRTENQEKLTYNSKGQLQEHLSELNELKRQFAIVQQQGKDSLQKEKESAEKRMGFYNKTYADQNAKDLEEATRANNLSRENQRQLMQDDIRILKRKLQETPTVENTKMISPEVEDHFKKQVADQFQESFDAQKSADKNGIENMRSTYNQKFRDSQTEFSNNQKVLTQRHAQDDHMQKTEFTQHSYQIQKDKQDTLARKDREHQRSTLIQQKTAANLLGDQKQTADDNIDALRQDSALALLNQRQKYEFTARLKNQEHTKQIDTLKRDADKQMTEVKDQYEKQLSDLQHKTDLELRNKEREFKRHIDVQEMGTRERLAQTEAAQKERERLINENFQDQMERMKRNHELQNKTKG